MVGFQFEESAIVNEVVVEGSLLYVGDGVWNENVLVVEVAEVFHVGVLLEVLRRKLDDSFSFFLSG